MSFEMDQATHRMQPALIPSSVPVLTSRGIARKLALVLLTLAECTEIDVANTIFITKPVTHAELAKLSGATERMTFQCIERFKRNGLISERRQRFILLQPSALRKLTTGKNPRAI